MIFRVLLLALACAAQLPAAAQLRPASQLGSAGAPGGGVRPADYIVAVVNSEPITNNEIRARLVRYEQQLAQQGAALPPREQLGREVLERLISERAQLQLAREGGLKVEESQVDGAEQNFARQNGLGVAELHRRLQADGVSPASFREDLRNQLLVARLREREVDQRVRVTDQEVEQFLRDQQTNADPAALELNLAHVLVALPDNPTEQQVRDARAKAERVRDRARAGEDFARLARESSDAAGAASNGGQLGVRSAERLPTVFVDAVRNLQEGAVTDVFRSGAGFHVVKVIERRQAGMPGLAVTQTRARHILLRTTPQLSASAARDRLAEFKRRIEAGQADFAQLAGEHSQDATAANGGDLGWTNPGTFVPEFEEAMNALAPRQIAGPVVSRFGVHLIQVMERRVGQLTAREQRDIARALVREKKLDEAYVQWARDVRGRAYVEFREPPT